MIDRADYLKEIRRKLSKRRIVALLGPRQSGKTTLARELIGSFDEVSYFDLEDPVDQVRLEQPREALGPLTGLVVIDEIQRAPDLFPLLRVLADRTPLPARFLILGSASPELVGNASESLAGRVAFVHVEPFSLFELGVDKQDVHWVKGGFPESFLEADFEDSFAWRRDFITTFLENDFSRNILDTSPQQLRRFWSMLAHLHGQYWNASKIARSLDVSHSTAKRYLDGFVGTYMVRALPPWHENMGKRIVKSPKVYIRDSGILHALLGLQERYDLEGHPSLGASWEGYALEQIVTQIPDERDAYFWATHAGAELDLMIASGGRRIGFEFKYSDAPRKSKSMVVASQDLGLEHLYVVYPGEKEYYIDVKISAMPLQKCELSKLL